MNDETNRPPEAAPNASIEPLQEPVVSGSMFLYQQPELLTLEDHGHLGLTNIDRPLAFTANCRAVPLVLSEFGSAQKHYPVVFSDMDNPLPLAALSLLEERNLFLDDNKRWLEPAYIPAYLRCYPLALANAGEDRLALVLDRAAEAVSENPERRFFSNGEMTEETRAHMEFCRNYHADRQRTTEFCTLLKELDLLAPQTVNQTVDGEQKTVAQYIAIDHRKLEELDKDTIADLFHNGFLASITAHLFSLENWRNLMRMQLAAKQADAEA